MQIHAGWFCGIWEIASFWLAPWVWTEVLCSLQTGTAGEVVQWVICESSPIPSESQEDCDYNRESKPRWPCFHPMQSSKVVFTLSSPALPILGVQCWDECWVYKSESALVSVPPWPVNPQPGDSIQRQTRRGGIWENRLEGNFWSFSLSPYSKALSTILKPLLTEI